VPFSSTDWRTVCLSLALYFIPNINKSAIAHLEACLTLHFQLCQTPTAFHYPLLCSRAAGFARGGQKKAICPLQPHSPFVPARSLVWSVLSPRRGSQPATTATSLPGEIHLEESFIPLWAIPIPIPYPLRTNARCLVL